jgi:ADP-heptose:LPS heptosyltransferase
VQTFYQTIRGLPKAESGIVTETLRGARRTVRRLGAFMAGRALGSGLLLGRGESHVEEVPALRATVAPSAHAPDFWTAPVGAPSRAGAHRILVLRIDERVGNVLLTTPLFAALSNAFPMARIDALIAASKRTLVEGLVNVIPFEKKSFFVRPWSFFRLLVRLRNVRYDVTIDASHWHEFSLSSAMLLAWTRAPVRIAHDRGHAKLFATHLVTLPESGSEVTLKLRLLEPLGVSQAEGRVLTALGTSGDGRARMEHWLESTGLSTKRLVGLAPGARKPDHRLPPRFFAELGAEVMRLAAHPLVLWGPGEEALAGEVAGVAGATVAPRTNLPELAALMRRCSAVVTNDTGPMHLSVACGAPTIAVFTRSDHRRWGHAYPPHAVIPADGRPLEEVLASSKDALRKILGISEKAGLE